MKKNDYHNDIVRLSNTNKTQILQRIRLKEFVLITPLEVIHSKEKLQPDDETVIPHDDLNAISWEADFDFDPRQDNEPNEAAQSPDNDTSSVAGDYVRTSRDGILSRDGNDINEPLPNDEQQDENKKPNTADRQDNPNSPKSGGNFTVPGISMMK